jgi:hypothetical protein
MHVKKIYVCCFFSIFKLENNDSTTLRHQVKDDFFSKKKNSVKNNLE